MRRYWRILLPLTAAFGGLAMLFVISYRPTPDETQVPASAATAHADAEHFVECHNGVVVSVSGPASDVGAAVLKEGGNAVDAAVATLFALAVSYPPAGNLGGGGFMLVHPAAGMGGPVVFDYRESAPAAASAGMYTQQESQFTHRAVATPGTVRGMAIAHRRFGTRRWAQLLRPAIALARDGFCVDRNLAETLNATLAAAPEMAELQRVFGKPDGGIWVVGDRLTQPDLAHTLQLLADQGPDAFYTGPIASEIVAEMASGKGLITAEDLAAYRAIETKPLHTRFRDTYDVYVPPPPSSGGMCLIEELHMLEVFDYTAWGRWSPKTLHVMAESMRRANYDRARYLGDPAFVTIPEWLTAREYGHRLAATINLGKVSPSEPLPGKVSLIPEGENTTHLSIIDRNGMAVANTYTLERRWGSRIVVKNMGFLLNNDMRAFNLFPGVADAQGNVGAACNAIAPRKRPLSSQTPTIVAKDGRVCLVTGSPGSQSIPHTVLCILLNLLDFGMPLETAVEQPRMSHQWLPDQITLEMPELHPDAVQALRALGHKVVRMEPLPQGDAHTIWIPQPGHYLGAADRRISGKASGY